MKELNDANTDVVIAVTLARLRKCPAGFGVVAVER